MSVTTFLIIIYTGRPYSSPTSTWEDMAESRKFPSNNQNFGLFCVNLLHCLWFFSCVKIKFKRKFIEKWFPRSSWHSGEVLNWSLSPKQGNPKEVLWRLNCRATELWRGLSTVDTPSTWATWAGGVLGKKRREATAPVLGGSVARF